MAVIVLVHGAWGTPAELAPVVPILEAAGHQVINVDLPCTIRDAQLEDYRAAVLAAMPADPDGDRSVLVVGHSFGGATIGLVRERRPDVALAYVTAVVPEPGQSLLQLLVGSDPFTDGDEDPWAAFDGLVLSTEPGMCEVDIGMLASMSPPEMRDSLLAELAITQRPQGVAAMRQGWPGTAVPAGRTSYVVATNDSLIPPDLQRSMAASVGADVYEVASDHSMFAEEPEALAAILLGIAGDLG